MELGNSVFNDLSLRLVIGSLLLFIFAWAYNRWIEGLEVDGRHEGFVSLLVVGGVGMVMLVGAGVLWGTILPGIVTLAVLAILFIAAGLPMIAGSIGRYVARRQVEQRRADELARCSMSQKE